MAGQAYKIEEKSQRDRVSTPGKKRSAIGSPKSATARVRLVLLEFFGRLETWHKNQKSTILEFSGSGSSLGGKNE